MWTEKWLHSSHSFGELTVPKIVGGSRNPIENVEKICSENRDFAVRFTLENIIRFSKIIALYDSWFLQEKR